jgi:hypothetical protein
MTGATQQTSWSKDPMKCHSVSFPLLYLYKESNGNKVHDNSTDPYRVENKNDNFSAVLLQAGPALTQEYQLTGHTDI